MTREKPNCTNCNNNSFVRTQGGGTHGKYRFVCDKCSLKWQQIPPHMLKDDKHNVDITICKKNVKRSSKYKCGKCGQIKQGHICTGQNAIETKKLEVANILVNNPFEPASNSLSNSNDDEEDTFSLTNGISPSMPFSGFTEIDTDQIVNF